MYIPFSLIQSDSFPQAKLSAELHCSFSDITPMHPLFLLPGAAGKHGHWKSLRDVEFRSWFKGFMKRWAIWGWRGKLEAVRYHVTICNECWKNINHKAIVKTKTKRICGNFIIGNICYYSEIASDTLQGLRICYQPLGQHILVMTTTHPFWIYVWDNIIYPYTMSYIYIYTYKYMYI